MLVVKSWHCFQHPLSAIADISALPVPIVGEFVLFGFKVSFNNEVDCRGDIFFHNFHRTQGDLPSLPSTIFYMKYPRQSMTSYFSKNLPHHYVPYCRGICCCSSYGFFKVICLHDTISLLRTPGSANQRTSLNVKPNSIAFEITRGQGIKIQIVYLGFLSLLSWDFRS